MALLHFLYKDAALIASLYAQIYSGLLTQITQESTSGKQDGCEGTGGVPTIAAVRANIANSFSEARKEVIDPHDAASLDVLLHVQKFTVEEAGSKSGDIVTLAGGLIFMPYAYRKILIDHGFESSRQLFDWALGNTITNKKTAYRNY